MKPVISTIGKEIEKVCKRYPDNEAIVHMEQQNRVNYSLFLWEIERVAKGLMNLDVKKGDKVSIISPNLSEWIISQIAIYSIGAVMVPVDPSLSKEELRYLLNDAEVKVSIVWFPDEEYLNMILSLRDELPFLKNIIVLSTSSYPDTISWQELCAMGSHISEDRLKERKETLSSEDLAAIMYTSGTTGRPKGVMLDHISLINRCICSIKRQRLSPDDRLCCFFPLFHMFGNTCIVLTGLLAGSSIVIPNMSFDPSSILRSIYKERCTAIYGSPNMIIALIEHPEFKKKRWATLRKGIIGGAPCPLPLMDTLVNDFGIKGILIGYGITETASWITMTRPEDPIELRVNTIGSPLECNQVKIVDPKSGKELSAGERGEICVKGSLMKGYFKMDYATKEAIDRDGWFHSGDQGYMDKMGYIHITGRIKDIIKRGDMEIHPSEIEEIIYEIPEVSEVQVVGVPDRTGDSKIVAWIKLKEGKTLSAETVMSFLKGRLDAKKMPDQIRFISQFPTTKSGKVQKFKLVEMAKKSE